MLCCSIGVSLICANKEIYYYYYYYYYYKGQDDYKLLCSICGDREVPSCVFINMCMIKHWLKILNMNVKQLVHVAYREILEISGTTSQ